MPRLATSRAFTLIELLIVIAVIAALAAMGFPIWGKLRRDAEINGTKALVQAVALAITSYERKDWAYLTATAGVIDATPRVCSIWDLNDDNILDTTPGQDGLVWERTLPHSPWTNNGNLISKTSPNDLHFRIRPMLPSATVSWTSYSYSGFYDMTNINVASRFINKSSRQLRDAWGQPLRIAHAANTYGTVGFGVWSSGPDAISAPDTAGSDDITSWK